MHRIHTNIESLCCRPETKVMLHVNYIGFLEGCLYGSSLVAQTVKCLPTMPTMWETQVQSLGQEDLLEKEMATHSVSLPGNPHGWWNLVGYSPWGCKELDTTERFHFTYMVQPHLYSVLYIIYILY